MYPPLPYCFQGCRPPGYEVGWDLLQSLELLKWPLMRVPTPWQGAEGCKRRLTEAQGKDLVISLYNMKCVCLCDVPQQFVGCQKVCPKEKLAVPFRKHAPIPWLSIPFHGSCPCACLLSEGCQ